MAQSATDADPTPQARLDQAARTLQEVRRELGRADTPDTLKSLADRTLGAQRDADAAARALAPELEQLDARLAQLGEVADGATEGSDIARQRRSLDKQRSDVDSAIKQGNLMAVEARQLAESIEKMRATQFSEQLARRVASPLSPSLWRQFSEAFPRDYAQLLGLYTVGERALRKGTVAHGWTGPIVGAVIALLLAFPLRLWLRRWGRHKAASQDAPTGRLRRSGLAVWLLLVGTVLPGVAAMVLVQGLVLIEAVPPRLEATASMFIVATFVAAFFAALGACLTLPHQPSWRLLALDDPAALRLRRYAWVASLLTFASLMLQEINRAARTSAVTDVAVDGLLALGYLALIIAILVSLARMHRRQVAEVEASVAEATTTSNDAGSVPGRVRASASRSGWIAIMRVAGHLAVLAAVIATLLGYLNFALFTAQQMVWGAVVFLSLSLLMKFADDVAMAVFAPAGRFGRTLGLASGLTSARLEQAGVLSSAVLRLCLLVLGVLALAAPFGNLNSIYGWLDVAARGVDIGGTHLTVWVFAKALLVLGIGLVVVQAFQGWLVDTYLPRTELDTGARNSISTVARYVGIILSALWALAALGIGFEKLALVVSALSVGIGFGLQAITQNFVSGLILLAERPVKIGDWVKIGDQEGDIRRISVRSTEIQVGDRSTLIVPNSELITKTIRNMTMANPQGRIQVQFSVPLNTDVGALKKILLQVYSSHENVLVDPAPSVFIDSIAGGQIAINSFAYVSSPRAVYGTRSELYFTLLQALAGAGIALSSPTDIHLVRDPEMQDALREP